MERTSAVGWRAWCGPRLVGEQVERHSLSGSPSRRGRSTGSRRACRGLSHHEAGIGLVAGPALAAPARQCRGSTRGSPCSVGPAEERRPGIAASHQPSTSRSPNPPAQDAHMRPAPAPLETPGHLSTAPAEASARRSLAASRCREDVPASSRRVAGRSAPRSSGRPRRLQGVSRRPMALAPARLARWSCGQRGRAWSR